MASTSSRKTHAPARIREGLKTRRVTNAVSLRVDVGTHETLRELSKEGYGKISTLLSQAVEDLRRKKFIEALNAEYAALRADPAAWESETKERAIWDRTLQDGATK